MKANNNEKNVAKEVKTLRKQVRALEGKLSKMMEGYGSPIFKTDHPHIIRVEGVQGGKPIVRGKSVTVQTIVALFKQDLSPEKIVEDYDGVLTLAEVHDALSYYYDHPGEIDQYLAENRAALEQVPTNRKSKSESPA